jgi:hypothetical protein
MPQLTDQIDVNVLDVKLYPSRFAPPPATASLDRQQIEQVQVAAEARHRSLYHKRPLPSQGAA